jgi:hypothetical protein
MRPKMQIAMLMRPNRQVDDLRLLGTVYQHRYVDAANPQVDDLRLVGAHLETN